MAYDVLFHDDEKCIHLPLSRRKEILRGLLDESEEVAESRYVQEQGKSFYREVVAQGLEGGKQGVFRVRSRK
jgi:ATP-dependent DNA ligase